MGPLIPNGVIPGEWSYIIALLIGLAFGYILEASGFSSSRKLAGVFYGYDFVGECDTETLEELQEPYAFAFFAHPEYRLHKFGHWVVQVQYHFGAEYTGK